MSEVKRYAPWDSESGMVEHQFGNWVDADDYDALRAENERLKSGVEAGLAEVERLQGEYDKQWRRSQELSALRQPVADEREAYDRWRKSDTGYLRAFSKYEWGAWQARAALSAPAAGQDVGSLPPFAEKVLAKLRRVEDCFSDNQGADVGSHWLNLLTQLGLLIREQRSPALWSISQQGEDALAAHKAGGGA